MVALSALRHVLSKGPLGAMWIYEDSLFDQDAVE